MNFEKFMDKIDAEADLGIRLTDACKILNFNKKMMPEA